MELSEIQKKIRRIAELKNAVILAHNYQKPEIQDIADFTGDSLNLSRLAADTKADTILFCGVTFMAETAKILSPKKRVLIPRFEANCPMANMITPDELRRLKELYPAALVIAYVNTSAEIKAMSDICCTSANADKIVARFNDRQIIFIPDKNLGGYCRKLTGANMIIYDGYCYVHNQLTADKLLKTQKKYPAALTLAHPECPAETLELADKIMSTEGMTRFVKTDHHKEYIIATEPGIIHRLKKEAGDKIYYTVEDYVECKTMKMTGIEDALSALENDRYEIELDAGIIDSAKKSLNQMLQFV